MTRHSFALTLVLGAAVGSVGAVWEQVTWNSLPDPPGSGLWERASIDWESNRWPHIYEATAYCACPICCGRWSEVGLTASGVPPVEGITVAVDRSGWRMGACLDIVGLGRRIAQDTGSAIVGKRIDIYFNEHERAKAFGRRLVVIMGCNGRER